MPDLLSTGERCLWLWTWQAKFWFRFLQCKSSIVPLPLAGLEQIYAAVIQREIWPIALCKDLSFYPSLVSPWEGRISHVCPVYPTGSLLKSIQAAHKEHKGGSLMNGDLCFIQLPLFVVLQRGEAGYMQRSAVLGKAKMYLFIYF